MRLLSQAGAAVVCAFPVFLFIGVFSPRPFVAWAGYAGAAFFSFWFLYQIAFNKKASGLYHWFVAFMVNTWFFAGVLSVYLLQMLAPDPRPALEWRQTQWLGLFAAPVEALRSAMGYILDALGAVVFAVSLLSCAVNLIFAMIFYLLYRLAGRRRYWESAG